MAAMRVIFLLLCGALAALPETVCNCDPEKPETMAERQCSLCREAEKQPADVTFFYLKDNNPRKPNRWLVLPRRHVSGLHHLHDLTKEERTALWKAAIEKGKELWGDEWGLAYNGEKVRTQCHTHIHIGKLLQGIETDHFISIRRAEEIPAPPGEGLWVHPAANGRMHVHLGEQTTETTLLR